MCHEVVLGGVLWVLLMLLLLDNLLFELLLWQGDAFGNAEFSLDSFWFDHVAMGQLNQVDYDWWLFWYACVFHNKYIGMYFNILIIKWTPSHLK